jgi:methyl-accepting chemotaxis protein
MFLEAMAKTEDDDRRRYERISGNGTLATLHAAKHEAMRVAINDISRGGVALRCDWHGTVGEEVKIELPGGDDAVVARMVRNTGGVLALTFRQDAAMLRRVDAALEHIGRQGLRAAA